MTLSAITIVALTIFFEARGEPIRGKIAVANVIVTRAQERNLSYRKVCLQPKQFSCWNMDKEKIIKKYNTGELIPEAEKDRWNDCKEIASLIFKTGRIKNTKNNIRWNHYYNPDLCNPSWSKQLVNKQRIGNHIFGRI